MEFLAYLTDGNVTTFFLLLLRFSAILAFFPFFDSQLVPVSVRGGLVHSDGTHIPAYNRIFAASTFPCGDYQST